MELARIRQGANIIGDSGCQMNQMPEWMDVEKFKRGQQFFIKHSAAIVLALHVSLTVGFVVSHLLEALVFNKATDTPPKALRRYLETLVHVVVWHTTDVWDSNTPSTGHQSLAFVRRVHRRVAKAMNDVKQKQDVSDKDVYISQYDMAIVQAGFMGAVISYPDSFGIWKPSRSELEDYVFFWRGIGYLLGIADEYNMCSCGLDVALDITSSIETEIVIPGLHYPPANFNQMADAYIDGINSGVGSRADSKEAIIAFSIPISRTKQHLLPSWIHLTWSDYLRIWRLKTLVFMMKYCPGVERALNWLLINVAVKSLMPRLHKQLSLLNIDTVTY